MAFSKFLTVAALGLWMAGCALIPRGQPEGLDLDRGDARRMRRQLDVFMEEAEQQLDSVTDQIRQRANNREVRQQANNFEERLRDQMRADVSNPSPVVGLLDAWQNSERYRIFLTEGAGKDFFGESQPAAVNLVENYSKRLSSILDDYTESPEALSNYRKQVTDAARKYPLQPGFREGETFSFALASTGLGVLGNIASLPLAPIDAASNVANTADSLNRLNDTAERFADIAEDYPYVVRGETERFLRDLHQSTTVTSVTLDLERATKAADLASRAADRASRVPDNIPELVRSTVRETLDEALAEKPELLELLNEIEELTTSLETVTANVRNTSANAEVISRQAPQGADQVLKSAQPVLAQSENTTRAVTEALAEAGRTVEKVQALALATKSEPDPDAPPREPFRIQDYTEALAQLEMVVKELRGTLEEVNSAIDTSTIDRLQAAANSTVATNIENAKGFVDHVIWRLAQLITLAGLLIVILAAGWYYLRLKVLPMASKESS